MTRLLFVGGPSTIGTTELADCLNMHEEILLCRERYKYVCEKVTPAHFTFNRILDYEQQQRGGGAETNIPREYHVDLVSRKNPERLKWIGDTFPGYIRWLEKLRQSNPGAKFILTYHPIEVVAGSYEERSGTPRGSGLGDEDRFEISVGQWNEAMRRTREFIESLSNPPVLLINCRDFFYHNDDFIPLISRFLDLELDERVRQAWGEMSHRFGNRLRDKESPHDEQVAFMELHKDCEAERWILDRIARQWQEPALYASEDRDFAVTTDDSRTLAAALVEAQSRSERQGHRIDNLRRRIGELEGEMARQQHENDMLQGKNEDLLSRAKQLEGTLRKLRSSWRWRLLTGLGRTVNRLLGAKRQN